MFFRFCCNQRAISNANGDAKGNAKRTGCKTLSWGTVLLWESDHLQSWHAGQDLREISDHCAPDQPFLRDPSLVHDLLVFATANNR